MSSEDDEEGEPKFVVQAVAPIEERGVLYHAARWVQEHNWQQHFTERAADKAAAEAAERAEDTAPTGPPTFEPTLDVPLAEEPAVEPTTGSTSRYSFIEAIGRILRRNR